MGKRSQRNGHTLRRVGAVIFVTTGTQLPFPRLITAMDQIAAETGKEVLAQIGPDRGSYGNLTIKRHLSPSEFETIFTRAEVVVAHAGIGTILTAKRLGRPLILLPRRHDFGEHRNDHQLATAREVEGREGVYIAWDADEIAELIARKLAPANDRPGPEAAALTGFLRSHIDAL